MRSARPLLAVASGALLAASVVGLVTRDDPAGSGGGGAPGTVAIAGFAYGPEHATVAVGGTVTWTNEDKTAHTVNARDGSVASHSIAPGGTFRHTFEQAGTFTYVCSFHPFMTGTVEVTR